MTSGSEVFCRTCRRRVLEVHARLVDEQCDGTQVWICCRCDDPERAEYERAVASDPNGGEGWS